MIRLALLNHLLTQRRDLRSRLMSHAGRSAAILVSPFSLRFEIDAEGYLRDTKRRADASITLPLTLLPRLALKDPSAEREVRLGGDPQLAGDLAILLQQLDWDAEADLARVVGDVAAHRMSETARQWVGDPRRIVRNLGESSLEYLESEIRLLVSKSALEAFNARVDILRDDTARLEKRLQALEGGKPE